MPDTAHHCPFLNRADERCSSHFSLDRLQHAFKFCFDGYKSCPLYLQLFVERQVRRASGAEPRTGDDANRNLVQISLPTRHPQRAA